MPAKNVETYVKACIESILDQSFLDWELIVVDDHSTDGTKAILKAFETQDNRIKVLSNNGKGIVDGLRWAYTHSSGEWIHRMDADDIMPGRKLEMLMEQWQPGSIVTGKVHYFSDEWLVGLGFQNYEAWINDLMESNDFWSDVYMECPIPSPAWLISRADFKAIGGFESHLMPEDYDLCFRAYKSGIEVRTVKEVVHHWRDSQNRTSRKEPIYFPMAYYPLKLHYFLDIDYDPSKDLVLWGAGKKGKRLASLLQERNIAFRWVTDNVKKQGVSIYNVVLQAPVNLNGCQLILAVSAPDDKVEIQEQLHDSPLVKGKDYWWFC